MWAISIIPPMQFMENEKKGYNQYREIKLSGKTYTGEAGTLVIKVVCRDGDIRLSWVKGRRK